ncbi:Rpp14/Pop5 family-domain-containing protein [Scheffersomyces amazonensis]|uniref:Rpp14/Pop5 family-domain-containing protein n=1 Tax=Scheffersomyces amazonensis TaxID=1078765 RepID=UPI00315C6336
MVRIKHRYILFEVLYPPTKSGEDSETFSNSQVDALLTLHQSSPSTINGKLIVSILRKSIQTYYGDQGAGTAAVSTIVKYWSNKTSTGIIRCDRSAVQMVVGALTLIDKLDNQNIIIRCTHISGTIHKCEEYSIRKSKELIRLINKQTSKQKNVSNFLQSLQEGTNINVSDKDDDDDDIQGDDE